MKKEEELKQLEQLEERDPRKRLARFKEVRPNWMAWEDCDVPGNIRGLYRYMGPLASVSQLGKAPIDGQNFSIGVVLCPPGNGPQLHDHTTEEVFIPLNGEWEVFWGENGEERIPLKEWDCISMPTNVMRGFINVGKESAYMLAIIAGDAPPVNWKDEQFNGRELK